LPEYTRYGIAASTAETSSRIGVISWGGQKGIDDTRFSHRYLVDYVRVYQQR
jgi:hypothetical protein